MSEVSAYLKEGSKKTAVPFTAMAELNDTIALKLQNVKSFTALSETDRRSMRTDVFLVGAPGPCSKVAK